MLDAILPIGRSRPRAVEPDDIPDDDLGAPDEHPTPQFGVEQGVYTCSWPDPIGISLEFDLVRSERDGDVTAEVAARVTTPGLARLVHSGTRTTLTGSRARSELAGHLEKRSRGLKVEWPDLVEAAAVYVIARHRQGDPAQLLRDVPQPLDAGWLLPPLVLSRQPSIIHGDGGTGKSYIALAAALAIQTGRADLLGIAPVAQKTCAYLDWEFDGWEHRGRAQRLLGDDIPGLVYVRCVGPIRDQLDRLRRIFRDNAVGFAVVDSVAPACGGEPESAEVALGFFEAIRRLGVGSLCIAHTTKSGDDERPFGSTFWHNMARVTWLAKKQQETSASSFTVGLFNKKSNTGPLAAPLAYEIDFAADRTVLRRRDVRDVPELAPQVSLAYRIQHALRGGPRTYAELAEELDAKADSIRRACDRGEGKAFTKVSSPDGIYRVALLAVER